MYYRPVTIPVKKSGINMHFNLKSYPQVAIATVVKGHQLSGCERKSIIWLDNCTCNVDTAFLLGETDKCGVDTAFFF